MVIQKIAYNINQRKENYKIGELQNYRKEIKRLIKVVIYDIFHKEV